MTLVALLRRDGLVLHSVSSPRLITLRWPSPLSAESVTANGEWLKGELAKQGIIEKQLKLLLPREDIVLRSLELPPAAPAELPDMVRLQTAAKSTVPIDLLVCDYWPLAPQSQRTTIDILVGTLARTALDPVLATFAKAGLAVQSVGVSSLALARLVPIDDQTTDQLVIHVDAGRADMAFLKGNDVVFAHALRLPADVQLSRLANLLAGDIKRAMISARKGNTGFVIAHVLYLLTLPATEPETADFEQQLIAALGCPVSRIADVLPGYTTSGLASHEQALARLLAAEEEPPVGEAVLNFLNPRRPPLVRNQKKAMLALAAGVSLVVAAILAASHQQLVAGLDTQIASLEQKLRTLKDDAQVDAPKLASHAAVQQWVGLAYPVSETMQSLAGAAKGTDRLYLSMFSAGIGGGEVQSRVQLKGQARSQKELVAFSRRLVDEAGYRVKPHDLTQTSYDADYPQKFELDLDLLVSPPAKRTVASAPSSP